MATLPPRSSPAAQNPEGGETGFFTDVSTFLGHFRWLFMPLGLFALIAIGVHAAADTVDDRIRFLVEQADAWLDTVLGGFQSTAKFVDYIGNEERTVIARAFTLVWELSCDVVIALPAFGYSERQGAANVRRFRMTPVRGWRELFRAVVREPTQMRLLRPLCTAALVVAGACAVGRMVQSSFYLTLRQPMTDDGAGMLARLFAVAAIVGVLASFGLRAVLRNLQHADEVAQKETRKSLRFTRGLVGTAIVLPLALAALLDASPLLSFLR